MDNDILKLLGTEYSLQIVNYRNGEYRIKVSNSQNLHTYRVITIIDHMYLSPNIILFATIELCISDLKQLSKDLSESNDVKTTKKDSI